MPAVEQWRYRNKLEYSFGEDEDGRLVLGFHPPGSWREVVEVEEDVLASPAVDALRTRVRDWCEDEGLSAYDRDSHGGFLRNLVVREGRRTGQLQARLVTSPGDFRAAHFAEAADVHSVLWSTTANVAEVTRDTESRVLSGAAAIEERIGSLRFSISPDAFFQTNTEMAERLYSVVAEFAGLTGSERVFDLFCGIGTIGLSLAPRAREVWGVEIVEAAVADAIANAELNGIENARFFAGDIRTAARPLVEQAGQPGRRRGRPSARRAVAEDRQANRRDGAPADRLRLVQPDDAGPERPPARRSGLDPPACPARGHVPADAAHRVRRAAQPRRVFLVLDRDLLGRMDRAR